MAETPGINPTVPPSGTGCVECLEAGGWWLHLRRCAECGHVGCCDTSRSQHATAHAKATSHPFITSFEPDEGWFFNYADESFYKSGPELTPPTCHPRDQPTPGPAGAVPQDFEAYLH